MKIIVTRPSPDGQAFAQSICDAQAEVILSPVMAIRPRNFKPDLSGIGALAFTSVNGVRTFAAMSSDRDFPVFAVGAATGALCEKAGFTKIATAQGDIESLTRLIAQSKPSTPVLHLAGSERIGDLVINLKPFGVSARLAVIYDAVEIEDLEPAAADALAQSSQNCAVVFFSPRSARLFARQSAKAGLAERLYDAVALAMSTQIADAAREACWGRIEIAEDLSVEAMAALARREAAARKSREGGSR
ncbi:MAG: uroporphyrinogen-III synthase [Parvularculaceae bacterium]|nr:uroporphyrinogen-III synthase [Parvularculaceae bacterium]